MNVAKRTIYAWQLILKIICKCKSYTTVWQLERLLRCAATSDYLSRHMIISGRLAWHAATLDHIDAHRLRNIFCDALQDYIFLVHATKTNCSREKRWTNPYFERILQRNCFLFEAKLFPFSTALCLKKHEITKELAFRGCTNYSLAVFSVLLYCAS